jgi:transcriptional regulator with XRE-family HTH domain
MALRRERVVERLSELRERAGLSQEDAARKVGVTHRQWQRWESGESMPYPRNLDRVASAFGIAVAEFFDDQPAAAPRDDTQLDRIEALLVELVGLLRPREPGGLPQPEGELGRRAEGSRSTGEDPQRSERHLAEG